MSKIKDKITENIVRPWKKYMQRDGTEKLDPTPLSLPVGFTRPIPLEQRIEAMVKSAALRAFAEQNDSETFEDADDFDLDDDDDFDPVTPYEERFTPHDPGAIAREQELRSGFREDRTMQKKAWAADRVKKFRDERAPKSPATTPDKSQA